MAKREKMAEINFDREPNFESLSALNYVLRQQAVDLLLSIEVLREIQCLRSLTDAQEVGRLDRLTN
jgi:hypothetical protein